MLNQSRNIVDLLRHRRIDWAASSHTHQSSSARTMASKIPARSIYGALESSFIEAHAFADYRIDSNAVLSTISIAISGDGEYVATTHGDHTVKIFRYNSGALEHVFVGHPRTPWTVKFHPTSSRLLASGCLGCEVRVWDVALRQCVSSTRYEYSIISLSFHPQGACIAVASGPELHVWDWTTRLSSLNRAQLGLPPLPAAPPPPTQRRVIAHSRNIRAVLFHHSGTYIYAAAPDPPRLPNALLTPCRLYAIKTADTVAPSDASASSAAALELWSMQCIIPQIHLYSDGGIDLSACGRYLFTCALVLAPPKQASKRKHLDPRSPASPREYLQEGPVLPPHPAGRAYSSPTPSRPLLAFSTPEQQQHALELSEAAYQTPEPTVPLADDARAVRPLPAIDEDETRDHPLWGGPGFPADFSPSDEREEMELGLPRVEGGGREGALVLADPLRSTAPEGWTMQERLCLFDVSAVDSNGNQRPVLLHTHLLTNSLMKAVTSVKLSPSNVYGLLGYGVRSQFGNVVEGHRSSHVACELLELQSMRSVAVMEDSEDEVNIAQFHPIHGNGVLYGTKKGKVRVYRRTGSMNGV